MTTILNDTLEALAYLLGAAVVTYPLVAVTLRQNAQDRHKRGHR